MVNKKRILVSMLAAASLCGFYGTVQAADNELDPVLVNADRYKGYASVSKEEEEHWLPGDYERDESHIGLLGDKDVMKVPYTTASFTQKAIDQFAPPNGTVQEVLANVPSVRIGTSPIKTDFSVRGMLANGSAMYLNNVPGFFIMASGPMTNYIGRMDVLVGPAATLTGSVQSYNGPDAGQPVSVFMYSKRPDVNLNRFTETFSGYGDWGENIDISRTGLGKDGSWGVRVYGQYDKGGMSISGSSRKRRDLFVDIEHKNEKSDTNLFVGTFDDRLWGAERRFLIDTTGDRIPSAPDANKSYDDPHFMHQFDYGWLMTLNHEQKINDHFSWFLNAGMNETTIRRFIYWSQIPIDQYGSLKGASLWSQHFLMENKYGQAGLKASFDTGALEHTFTVSVDRSWRKHYNAKRKDKAGAHAYGNIYTGIFYRPSMYDYDNSEQLGNTFMYQEMDTGLNLTDDIKSGKWNILLAANRRHGNYRSASASDSIKDDHWSPTFGASYAPNDRLTIYGSYSKSVTRGQIVEDGYVNEGERLKPVELEQKEIGVKYKWKDLLATLAYFDMEQPNAIDVYKTDGIYYEMNGRNRYKGVDFTLNGKLAPKWTVLGGFEYLHARQQDTEGGLKDGMPTDGSAKWSTVAGLEYHPNEDISIMGRLNYTGHGVITGNNRKELRVPSYTTFDLLLSYKSHIGHIPVTWNASCYNVFNKDHWVLQPGQGSKLMLDMPRTYIISASFDF